MKALEGKTILKLNHSTMGELMRVLLNDKEKPTQLKNKYKDEFDDWHPHF